MVLRPITGAIPPDGPWGIWASRRIIAGLMGTFGPSLAGTRVEQVNSVLPDGRRVVGEWVYEPHNNAINAVAAPSITYTAAVTRCVRPEPTGG